MVKNKRNKKAIFFSLDALIALVIILLSITVIYPIIKYSERESRVPEDILSSLSALKIGDMGTNNLYVQGLIDGGDITDLNKSVLEQIGEFYVSEETKPLAEELARQVLLTIDTNENIGLWYGGELLVSKNKIDYDDAKNVNVERQIISGIRQGEAITGYSARAFLSNSEQTKYYYFGGYVGEGNITLNIDYSGLLKEIKLEIVANKNFNIYVNNVMLPGIFEPAEEELEPEYFDLSAYIEDYFEPGINTFKLIPADGINNFHVAGGYLKLTYEDGVQYEQAERYYFPGINGIVNLYDGFYVPGELNNLEVNVQARVDDPEKKIYMKFGNIEIFNETTGGISKNIIRTNEEIEEILDEAGKNYLDFSSKTIPIRIGIVGIDYEESEVIAEIFSSPSLSASSSAATLKAIVDGTEYSSFEAVIKTNEKLVELVLGIGNLVYMGLTPTGVGGVVPDNMYHELSQDESSLISTIEDEWAKGNNKDFCAGIQKSFDNFNEGADFRAIVLTVFDEPNQCREWEDEFNLIVEGTLIEKIKTKVCNLADPDGPGGNDPVARLYSVDVGLSTPAENEGIQLLKDIADCSDGEYFRAELDDGLMDAYEDIITKIKDLIYNMQTIDIIKSANAGSYLSPDSYIEFDYDRTEVPYGIIISSEKMFDDENGTSFEIPADSQIVETKVISYSGSRWTKDIKIINEEEEESFVYNLDDYGLAYLELGDPYAINIPNAILEIAGSYNVKLRTATTPIDIFPGSPFNKIIYTIVKNMNSFSQIASNANGCEWYVEFEDEDSLIIRVPDEEETTDTCFYQNIDDIPTITCERAGFQGDCEDSDDALKIAIYNLFKKLDNDEDGRLDTKFEEQNLEITSSEITGIPYPWETEVQVRKWW